MALIFRFHLSERFVSIRIALFPAKVSRVATVAFESVHAEMYGESGREF